MPKTKPEPINKDEVELILREALKDGNEFAFNIMTFAKKTGKRLGEIYDLKVKDFNPNEKIIFTRILKRKRPVEKETILDDDLCLMLDKWIKENKLKLDDYIFHKVGYRQIQNLPNKYARRAGITKKVMFHSFRHYFITALVREGWPYDKIQKLTGHANVSTLNNYDSATSRDIEVEARKAIKNI